MPDPNFFDQLTKKFAASLPPGVKEWQADMERNFRAVLQGAFEKLDLVTREEFDVQVNVLKRTRAKLDAIEKQLAALSKSAEPGKTKRAKKEE
jgi:BMFP domain-containing protein YqiC